MISLVSTLEWIARYGAPVSMFIMLLVGVCAAIVFRREMREIKERTTALENRRKQDVPRSDPFREEIPF